MRWLLIFFLFSFSFTSCFSEEKHPKDILKPDQMQLITWDMLQADELATQNKSSDTSLSLKKESFRLYEQVFAVHKTNRSQYYKSYKYYQEHPSLYKSMMDGVKKLGEKEKKAATATPAK